MSKAINAELVVDKYYMDVYKFCCARCKDPEAAQDITQDTFTVFLDKRKDLIDLNLRAWLLTVANNKMHEHFKKMGVEENFLNIDDINIPTYDNYDKEINIDEIFDDVQQKILKLLTDSERELFIKLYIEKKSVSLIKEELDITDANLRKRKSRIKKKVKDSIEHLYFFMFVVSFKMLH